MKTTDLIKKPILTEKAYKQMEKGLYTFLVDAKADKAKVAKAVAEQFSVSVEKVNIGKTAPKTKRIGKTRKMAKVGGGKKATVWVKKGEIIASLLPKAGKRQTKGKKAEGPERSRREKEVEKAEGPESGKTGRRITAEGKEG
ncbi:50S ribosomal protein L23 [Candidatus Curtissbacteria bacterium]|nr:50S ribosomal protein L23 [Candidatus Curtissbacteria bacterium]